MAKKVHLTNQSRQERQPLTREEMMDAISRIPRVVKPLDRCFIAIQALHAMRPCEVLGLKWEDIDIEKGVLHIRRNVVHPTRNLPVVGDTKTQLSKRAVGISQIALPYIQEASQSLHRKEDFIFGGPSPLSYTQHRKLMYRITKQMMCTVVGYQCMSDELAVMDGRKCILQLRGVRPFFSDKYDITQHPNYRFTADADPRNTFNIEKHLSTQLKLRPDEEYTVYEVDVSEELEEEQDEQY